MTFQLIYWGTYTQIHPKLNIPVCLLTTTTYLSPQLLVYLPIFVPIHGPVYFDTFIPINCLDLPVNISTVLHVHRRTCSSIYLLGLFLIFLWILRNDHSTYLLEYLPKIHPKIHLPVYIHASLSSNHKVLPVTTTTCVPAHIFTRSWSYLFILILSFRLTV